MAVFRYDLLGSPNIGVFSLATDEYVLVPVSVPKTKIEKIKRFLNVKAIRVNIGSSLLIGVLATANSHGIVLPNFTHDEDVKVLKSALRDVNIERIASKQNALGNLILTNDYGAVADPRLSQGAIRAVSDVLGVEVVHGEIAGFPYVGSLAIATNSGVLAHPMLREDERKILDKILKVPVDVGTVNCGVPYIRSGIIANRHGAVVGSITTGPELVIVGQALNVTA